MSLATWLASSSAKIAHACNFHPDGAGIRGDGYSRIKRERALFDVPPVEIGVALSRVTRTWRSLGPRVTLETGVDRLLKRKSKVWPIAFQAIYRAQGIEIGGPSGRFGRGGPLPLYSGVSGLDNVNFAGATLWEPSLVDGGDYSPEGKRLGTQHISEASELAFASTAHYDFVMSSHTLEHLANPLLALREWRRVVKTGGAAIVVVPDGQRTFDHRREVTSLEHLRQDFDAKVGEDDETHVAEILKFHDLSRDPGLTHEVLHDRLSRNLELRSAHHHVFDKRLLASCMLEAGWQEVAVATCNPYDLVVVARNSAHQESPESQVADFDLVT